MSQSFCSLFNVSSAIVPTTTRTPVCTTINYTACSNVIFQQQHSGATTVVAYTPVTCCYVAPTKNFIIFDMTILDDTGGFWKVDDISATQGYGELISNGGFEFNMTNWTLTVYSNATSSIDTPLLSGGERSGTSFLYGAASNAYVYVKQTFSIIRGENVLINFWWDYQSNFGGGSGTSELTITLI